MGNTELKTEEELAGALASIRYGALEVRYEVKAGKVVRVVEKIERHFVAE